MKKTALLKNSFVLSFLLLLVYVPVGILVSTITTPLLNEISGYFSLGLFTSTMIVVLVEDIPSIFRVASLVGLIYTKVFHEIIFPALKMRIDLFYLLFSVCIACFYIFYSAAIQYSPFPFIFESLLHFFCFHFLSILRLGLVEKCIYA